MTSSREYMQGRHGIIGKRDAKRNVYIGLDFGTTFAKVAYEVAPTTEHLKRSIRFNDDGYYIPTELFYHWRSQSLWFKRKGTPDESIVRFFKYSMVVDGLEKNEELNRVQGLRNNPERLCSAYYLACLITISKLKICKQLNVEDTSTIEWHINMGMPVGKVMSANTQLKPVYDEVLQVAWAWSTTPEWRNPRVGLKEFDDFYTLHRRDRNPNLQTVPELYAEVLMYQQDNNVPEGFYAVIDIGGGTVDLAVFLKKIDKEEGVKVYCVSHEVSPEGMESIVSRVAGDPEDSVRDKVRGCMLNRNVNFNQLGDVNLADRRLQMSFRCKRLINTIKNFRTTYGSCVMKARENKFTEMRKEVENGGRLRYFMMGGGKDVHFYNQLVEFMIGIHAMEVKTLAHAKKERIQDYMLKSVNLECKDDDRLLISQMLAQPFDNIPQLDGVPWDFTASTSVRSFTENLTTREKLEDRLLELYGDD